MSGDPTAIIVDADTARVLRLASAITGLTEGEVVANLVRNMDDPPTRPDPWKPVEIHGVYGGVVTNAQYVAATRRLRITSGPLNGRTFGTPSAAASAVVAVLNPGRATTQTNGWQFWRVTATGSRLAVLR